MGQWEFPPKTHAWMTVRWDWERAHSAVWCVLCSAMLTTSIEFVSRASVAMWRYIFESKTAVWKKCVYERFCELGNLCVFVCAMEVKENAWNINWKLRSAWYTSSAWLVAESEMRSSPFDISSGVLAARKPNPIPSNNAAVKQKSDVHIQTR